MRSLAPITDERPIDKPWTSIELQATDMTGTARNLLQCVTALATAAEAAHCSNVETGVDTEEEAADAAMVERLLDYVDQWVGFIDSERQQLRENLEELAALRSAQ